MGAEHGQGAFGDFGQFFNEHSALGLQPVDDVAVVHDLVAHIDRPPELLQRLIDNVDCADHAGAKAARLSQYYTHDLVTPCDRIIFHFAHRNAA